MAKAKYFDKGIFTSLSGATEALIKEFIIPNSVERMKNQEFRDLNCWNLDIDDLFKANKQGITQIYQKYKNEG